MSPVVLFVAAVLTAVPGPDPAGSIPADGLGLAPSPVSSGRTPPSSSPVSEPRSPGAGLPVGAGLLGGIGALGIAVRPRRRLRQAEEPSPLYVYVPGHGGDPDGFDDLAARIGVDQDRFVVFDYRWVWPSDDPIHASRWALTSEAAGALHAQIATLSRDHEHIYVVAHSKGGAIVTEMVARWDERPGLAVAAVSGAILLDPPIAPGPLGWGQSAGWLVGGVADDGRFDPIRCGWSGCRDIRSNLGTAAGVEVVVVRNPDAVVTNFRDRPDGLRVYELDDGGANALSLWRQPGDVLRRVGEAHSSVLHSDAVAACITAESATTGSCRWPEPEPDPAPAPEPASDVPKLPLRYWGFGESNGPSSRTLTN